MNYMAQNEEKSRERPFIRGAVAIESMRDNGYKNAAYALAELIDNSIQARADHVQLMCFDTIIEGKRQVKRVEKIGIFDNGRGMSKETLHLALEFGGSQNREDKRGMGKFGMGLPNSSISQCKKVEVWTWQNGESPVYTYLDIEEMQNGELETIPYPQEKKIPKYILDLLPHKGIGNSGTFILWSDLDRLQWKTSGSIFTHSEHLVGRMYRNFIARQEVRITFKSYIEDPVEHQYKEQQSEVFRANDPLYLTRNTSLDELPGNFKGEVPFEEIPVKPVEIDLWGEKHFVEIRASKIKKEFINEVRKTGNYNSTLGHTPWGKHMAKNSGLSVMRAGRELEVRTDFFEKEFLNQKARFMGIQVEFGPALDKVFGVLNNKQAAVNFYAADADTDAVTNGFDDTEEYLKDLKENGDPKRYIYQVSKSVQDVIDSIKKDLKTLNVLVKDENARKGVQSSSEKLVNKKIKKKIEKGYGNPNPVTEKHAVEIEEKLEASDLPPETVKEILEKIKNNEINYKQEHVRVDDRVFFDASPYNGFTLLQLNINHPFYTRVLEKANDDQKEILELCLGAWAKMEADAVSQKSRDHYRRTREDWGRYLHDFLLEDDEE